MGFLGADCCSALHHAESLVTSSSLTLATEVTCRHITQKWPACYSTASQCYTAIPIGYTTHEQHPSKFFLFNDAVKQEQEHDQEQEQEGEEDTQIRRSLPHIVFEQSLLVY